MASISRIIAKDCNLQSPDAIQRPSYGLQARRLHTHVSFRGGFGLSGSLRSSSAIQNEQQISVALGPQRPCSIIQSSASRNSKILCKAATDVHGDLPSPTSSEMSQYERIIETLTTLFPLWVILGTVIGIYKPAATFSLLAWVFSCFPWD